jgi:hypothetical protein
MTQVTATVVSQPITATVSGGNAIAANVGSSTFTAAASGGIGPQGPAGAAGVAVTAEDLQLTKVDAVRGVLVHQEVAPQRAVATKAVKQTIKTSEGDVTIHTTRKPRAINLGD